MVAQSMPGDNPCKAMQPLSVFMWLKCPSLLIVIAGLQAGCAAIVPASAPSPNMILTPADDLGWAELATQGSFENRTSNLDSLAAQGPPFSRAGRRACLRFVSWMRWATCWIWSRRCTGCSVSRPETSPSA